MNLSRRSEFIFRFVCVYLLLLSCLTDSCFGCGPGRGNNRRRNFKKLKPLVYKQHEPNVAENTLGASGLPEGRITRDDKEFKNLVPNYNPDIIFRDDEGTGADRLMTQRLKERLNTLAISVLNEWPGVKLRVIEGWDEEGAHAENSLHYEGRAAEIMTSDRDMSKYGMLARLAVEAGFDWVFYQSRSHIYVSVKSESSQAAKSLGCFTGDSIVITETGRKTMSELEVGEKVLSLSDDGAGRLDFSEILLFMHRDTKAEADYIQIRTASGTHITLTASHLILRARSKPQQQTVVVATTRNSSSFSDIIEEVYAIDIEVGQELLITAQYDTNTSLLSLLLSDYYYYSFESVTSVERVTGIGVYAPLTMSGMIVVNDVIASCYAVINSHRVAHLAFAPLRFAKNLQDSLLTILRRTMTMMMMSNVPPPEFLKTSLLTTESSFWQTRNNSALPITFNFNIINSSSSSINITGCKRRNIVLDYYPNKSCQQYSHNNNNNSNNHNNNNNNNNNNCKYCTIVNNDKKNINSRFNRNDNVNIIDVSCNDDINKTATFLEDYYFDCNNGQCSISKSHSDSIKNSASNVIDDVKHVKQLPTGIHWYCKLLESISEFIIPHSWMMFQ